MNRIEHYMEYSAQYEQSRQELLQQAAAQERLESTARNDCSRKYAVLKTEILGLQAKLKPTIAVLRSGLFSDILQVSGGRFAVGGRVVPALPFDADSVFAVAEGAKTKMLATLKVLLSGAGNAAGSLATFAQCYNTLSDIGAAAETLKAAALETIISTYEGKKRQIAQELEQLEARHQNAQQVIPDLLADDRLARDGVLLNGRYAPMRDFPQQVQLPLGYRTTRLGAETDAEILTAVAKWDLKKDAVLHLRIKKGAEDHAPKLIEDIFLQLLRNYYAPVVKIDVCNPGKDDTLTSFFGRFRNDDHAANVFFRSECPFSTEQERQDIGNAIGSLNTTLKQRLEELGEQESVLQYNENNQDTAYPLILLVLDDYSDDYKDYHDILRFLFAKGLRGGVYSLVLEREEKKPVDRYDSGTHVPDLSQISALTCLLRDENGKAMLTLGAEEYDAGLREQDFFFPDILGKISQTLKEENKFLPLQNLLKGRAPHDDFSKAISVPIGKSGTKIVHINLDIKSDPHAVIAGMSGSGKSSLLQSIILGGGYLYSPDQLQFWVLDFKDGNGLIQFQTLKHVKMMSVKNRAIDAMEIMGYIEGEYKRRAELIKESGGGDIEVFNRKRRTGGGELLPRLLIIIDEFTQMPRECAKTVEVIAKKGRSLGIGLILASQKVDTNGFFQGAVEQASHRFEFRNQSSVGHLIGYVDDAYKSFVNSGFKGNCLYKKNATPIQMRAAYAGDFGAENYPQELLIAEINEKWKDYPYEKPIVTGNPERNIRSIAQRFFDANKAKMDYQATNTLSVPVGVSRLGQPSFYKINRDKPVLLICGDESRAASWEYSMASFVTAIADGETCVYYFDFNANFDRKTNAILESREEKLPGLYYARSDGQILDAINAVYGEYRRRQAMISQQTAGEKGCPIEIIVHNAERLLDVFSSLPSKGRKPEKESRVSFSTDVEDIPYLDDLAAMMDAVKQKRSDVQRPKPVETDDGLSPKDKLKEILTNGKNFRIFVSLHFEDMVMLKKVRESFLNALFEVRDALVLPPIPEESGHYSGKIIKDYLSTCGIRTSETPSNVTNSDSNEMTREDFYYAVVVDGNVPYKLIPYEWEA